MFIDTECIICNDNKAQQFASNYIQINHNLIMCIAKKQLHVIKNGRMIEYTSSSGGRLALESHGTGRSARHSGRGSRRLRTAIRARCRPRPA